MNIKYDKIADALYLMIKKDKVNKTIEVNDRLILDLNKKGDVVGVEMLDYSSSKQNARFLEDSVKYGVPVEILSRTPVLI